MLLSLPLCVHLWKCCEESYAHHEHSQVRRDECIAERTHKQTSNLIRLSSGITLLLFTALQNVCTAPSRLRVSGVLRQVI